MAMSAQMSPLQSCSTACISCIVDHVCILSEDTMQRDMGLMMSLQRSKVSARSATQIPGGTY